MSTWRDTFQPARFSHPLGDGRIRCGLCPRHCTLREGQFGFCGVRGHRDGQLMTYNFGKSVHATEEMIETEAVYHYAPGSRILSLGNIGCMMNCAYCHNWKTSQARFVSDEDVHRYTPQEVVDRALRHGITTLSWTYNDPVVWHEFVVETATLAQRHGLRNLYKSAFYITPEAVEELIPVMDIFSISIKSMDPTYYRKITKGELAPVLAATKQVHRSGRHLEVSNLMITDVSDDEAAATTIARFVLDELAADVPLHFVRFHPDYQMTNSVRTPIPRLEAARRIAQELGVHHVYLGNVYGNDATNTTCRGCGAAVVQRFGMSADPVGLTPQGTCRSCGLDAGFRGGLAASVSVDAGQPDPSDRLCEHRWQGDVRSLHLHVRNGTTAPAQVRHRSIAGPGAQDWRRLTLAPGESYRVILATAAPNDVGVIVAVPLGVESSLHDVFDRAHFPTLPQSAGSLNADISPFPAYGSVVRT